MGDSDRDGDDDDTPHAEEMERFEMRANSVVEIIQPENVIVLCSPPEALDLFIYAKLSVLE